jgi:acyl-CoA dehydrogenase
MAQLLHGSSAWRREDQAPAEEQGNLRRRAERAASVAATYANEVDALARFPKEAFDALKSERLLGILAPPEFGGDGATAAEMAEVCYILGRACSATALIYAMHQTKVACLVQFGRGNLWQEGMLRRLVREQLLMASSTTEGAKGGDLRTSEAPIVHDGPQIQLVREASCISYGEQADCIMTTARRSVDSAGTQQVVVTFPKEGYTLERCYAWDTLGMRGTCSVGFVLRAHGVAEQILAEPFDRINARCMMPVAHLAWSSVWAGIAAATLQRARGFVLQSMRAANGKAPSGAVHLTRAASTFETLRNRIAAAARRYEDAKGDDRELDSIEFQSAMNLLKVEASELAVSVALSAMRICGLSGYRNDTEFSVGRHLRDLLSSPLMISNDRILANMGSHALLCEVPDGLGV